MKKKIFTVAILGCGARGGNVYGSEISARSEQFKITALCDKSMERLVIYGNKFGVPVESRFTDEERFFEAVRADIMLITTYDKDHARQATRALRMGYHVMLEKPVAVSVSECCELLSAVKESGKRSLVCHVLRYSDAYRRVKEILDSGRIGRLVTLLAEEPVNYWHQAHSFVRGNAASSESSAPMILAKCCHDLDLISYYAGAECRSVSSIGGLSFFTEANAPEGAADRCLDCSLVDTCPYSAKRIYIDGWLAAGCPENSWPTNALTVAPVTEKGLIDEIRNGKFGRCVFKCDNDAVDHQLVQMTFKNDVKANLNMTAFNTGSGRRYLFGGTLGTLELTDTSLTIKEYGGRVETYLVSELNGAGEHGGGDVGLIDELYRTVSLDVEGETSIESSVDGYLIGIAAEESRKRNGELIVL